MQHCSSSMHDAASSSSAVPAQPEFGVGTPFVRELALRRDSMPTWRAS
jgi:hypothetical protein